MKVEVKDYFSLSSPLAAWRSRLSLRARRRMFERFCRLLEPSSNSLVLDLGVTPDTSMCDSNFFEACYPYPERITAASIEDASFLEGKYPGLRFVKVDGERLPFSDKEFDVLFCSAVLEHVGGFGKQKAFLQEVFRVSNKVFLTTPNRWYPIDFHTMIPLLHWLPRKWHRSCLKLLGYSFLAKEENLNLLSAGDVRRLLIEERARVEFNYFLGLPSNLIIHNAH